MKKKKDKCKTTASLGTQLKSASLGPVLGGKLFKSILNDLPIKYQIICLCFRW